MGATEKLVKLPRAHDGSDTNTSGVDFPFLQEGTFGGKLESNISKGSSQVGKRVSDFLSLADAFESMSSRDRGAKRFPGERSPRVRHWNFDLSQVMFFLLASVKCMEWRAEWRGKK